MIFDSLVLSFVARLRELSAFAFTGYGVMSSDETKFRMCKSAKIELCVIR